MAESTSTQARPGGGRKTAIAIVFVLAIITGFGAITSTWVKRQILDNGNWESTSSKLLASKNIQNTLGTYLVTQLFTNVDVAGQLQKVLPAQAAALATPAAAGLQQIANQEAPKLLAQPVVQDAWRKANAVAHKQLLNVLNGGGKTVSTQNGEVALNVHSLVDQLAATLGLEKQVAAAREKLAGGGAAAVTGALQQRLNVTVPKNTGDLVIMKSDQIAAAQDYAKGLRNISIVLTVLSLGLFALAVWLGRGARRVVFRAVGWSFFGLGVACLLARRVGGNNLIDSLVKTESVKPAAHDAWNIATSLLYSISISMVIYGLLIVACAWLAGPSSLAVATRSALAPTLRDHSGRIYAVVGGLYLLVLLWGPTPAFRNFIPIVLIACLLAIGIETLRRQTAREFPGALAGGGGHALRAWYDTHVSHHGAPAPANGGQGHVDELERLVALHKQGAITDDEFNSEKAVLISHT